jgi:glycine/D-amino acid oxidase-like deaminating enzyme
LYQEAGTIVEAVCSSAMLDTHSFHHEITAQSDLHGGVAPWLEGAPKPFNHVLKRDIECEILIVGGGITGSLLAEHLAQFGYHICVIDREIPGFGSTAASTAMLQWEIDCSLSELTELYGFERAANIYWRSFKAVSDLEKRVTALSLPCAFRSRNSLYVAGGKANAREIWQEHCLREKAGLPGKYLDHVLLKHEFGFDRPAAILSPGSADADPVQLAHGFMKRAVQNGAKVFNAQAIDYDSVQKGVVVTLDNGHVIQSKAVVLATGYVMPDFIKTELHKTASSWAIATPRQKPSDLWRDGVLVWEACEPYLYARTTIDGRIIIGGEDDDSAAHPLKRDLLIPAKTAILLDKLKELWPSATAEAEFVWSGAFGETEDGLPLIGTVSGHPHIYAAYGYGGNGITFSFLASRIIAKILSGHQESWFDEFALDRPKPK